jgi:hypothetical protein
MEEGLATYEDDNRDTGKSTKDDARAAKRSSDLMLVTPEQRAGPVK